MCKYVSSKIYEFLYCNSAHLIYYNTFFGTYLSKNLLKHSFMDVNFFKSAFRTYICNNYHISFYKSLHRVVFMVQNFTFNVLTISYYIGTQMPKGRRRTQVLYLRTNTREKIWPFFYFQISNSHKKISIILFYFF